MFRSCRCVARATLFILLIAHAGSLSAQPAKKVLTFADSDIWRTASIPVLSPDGTSAAYAIWPGEGDGEAIVRNIPSGKEYKFPRGGGASLTNPTFSPDSKLVLLPLTPTGAETEKAKADKAKSENAPQSMLAVVDAATGRISDKFPSAGAFTVGGEGRGFVIYRKPAPPAAKEDDAAPAGPMGGKAGAGKGGGGRGKGQFPAKGGGPASPRVAGELFGTDLHLRDLASKAERVIADVAQFSLTKDGQLLVYTVASKNEDSNGVYALNPRSGGAPTAIKTGAGKYSSLSWDEKQSRLAFLVDTSAVAKVPVAPPPRLAGTNAPAPVRAAPVPPPQWRAFVWERTAKSPIASLGKFTLPTGGLASLVSIAATANIPSASTADEVLGPNAPGLRSGWNLSSGSLTFSADGKCLFVNTAPPRKPAATAPTAGAAPRPDDFELDLWHWQDARLQPMQKLQAAADQARTYSGIVHLDSKKFLQLSDETISVGQPAAGSDWALGHDNSKYAITTGFGPELRDYSLVHIHTGEKKPILTAHGGYSIPAPSYSHTGKHLLIFDGKDWLSVSLPDGKKFNLTGKVSEKFFDEEDDHPGSPRPAGTPQWTTDGKFALIPDRHDIWKFSLDGSSAENITKIGRAQNLRFTITRAPAGDEAEPQRGVDLSKPHLLSAENLLTRDTGFYRLEPGNPIPKLLIMGSRRYGAPIKAKHADVYLFTVQTFYDSPDYFATSGDFHELKRVTTINPRIREYNWGKAELVHFSSADGVPLSGVLIKPENFDPSKKYPMVVYIYERLSNTLHQFHAPSVTRGQVINPTFYASNGYLVLMPDIAYKVGSPGQSAIKSVLPAIQAVANKGYVDEKAIGIDGQSWGGYQIAYMVTQTDRFKAAVAGAPVSNMVSAYDGIRWGSGLTRQFQYEWTQSRIGSTLWQAPMKFIENSPVFMADRVTTPLLMISNDQDDAVPWYQGIEYYLALRRLGKECYMLNYNGQPHNLTSRAAARDFAARMFQFFEHHLRGKPEPAWMAKGVPYLDRDKEKEEIKKLYQGEKK